MTAKPQQPEVARSGRSETVPAAAKARHGGPTEETPPRTDAIPEDNLPGHRPEHDQDKPEGPPPRPRARPRKAATATKAATEVAGAATATITDLKESRPQPAGGSFRFAFEPRLAPLALPFGVTPWTTGVDVADGELRARFGPWSLRTPLDNIASAEVTGPYSILKVAGPARLSLSDRGLTFATSTKRGVCIRFKQPVPGIAPRGLVRHPGLTVTVEDPEQLAALLRAET